MRCPTCSGPTVVIKTEPTAAGGTARLRRCARDGRFWTRAFEKLDHWLPATAIADSGNGNRRQIADRSPLGGLGGSDLFPSDLSDRIRKNPAASQPPNQTRPRVEPPRFAEFWSLYPRKVARAAALKNWIKQKLDQQADLIIAAIQLQAPDFLARETDKIPHAATWLNQERWKDEIDRRPRLVGRPAARASIPMAAWSTD